jgi:hypothetical protein
VVVRHSGEERDEKVEHRRFLGHETTLSCSILQDTVMMNTSLYMYQNQQKCTKQKMNPNIPWTLVNNNKLYWLISSNKCTTLMQDINNRVNVEGGSEEEAVCGNSVFQLF